MKLQVILAVLGVLVCSDAAGADASYLVLRPEAKALGARDLAVDLFRALDRDDAVFEPVGGRQAPAFRDLTQAGILRADNSFIAPYFSMLQNTRHRGLSVELGKERRLRFGAMSESYGHAEVLPVVSPFARRTMASIEIEQRRGAVAAIFSLGVLRDSGSRLSNIQSNGLAHGSSARTVFSALSVAYALNPRVSLVGMASAGRSTGFVFANPLEGEAAPVYTASLSAGMSARRLWDDSDRLGLTLTVPTRVTRGATSLAGAALQRDDGSLSYSSRMLNLAPSATERDLELSYSRHLGGQARVAASIMLRINPDHTGAAPSQLLLGVRYGKKF